MVAWKFLCLICGEYMGENLVAIQEHAMEDHGYRQDDIRNVSRFQVGPQHYVYTMPDDTPWLYARK